MNRFAYRIYYEYSGPTNDNPLRSPKELHEIEYALSRFSVELRHYLSDDHAVISDEPTKRDSNSQIVIVATSLDEVTTDQAIKQCLNGLDLYGCKLDKV